MPRNRQIKPDFWADEKIGKVSPLARLLFIGIWNFCDDIGVCRANAGYLRSQILQFDDMSIKEVEGLLGELVKSGRLVVTEINSERFLFVKNFLKHQQINKPSTFRFIEGATKDNIAELFNSRSTPVVVTDDSRPNVKENENENENVNEKEKVNGQSMHLATVDNIIPLWNEELSGIGKMRPYPGYFLAAGARDDFLITTGDPGFQLISSWRNVFQTLGKSERVADGSWTPSLPWAVKHDNVVKILSGTYEKSFNKKQKSLKPEDDISINPFTGEKVAS